MVFLEQGEEVNRLGQLKGEKVFVDGSGGVSMRKNRTWYYPERLFTDASVDDVLIY